MTNKEKISKLELKGWVDKDERKWSIEDKCPICGGEVSKTDAIGLIGIILVCCKNSKCRWCMEFKE